MPGATDYDALLEEFASIQFPDFRPAQSVSLRLYASEYTEASDIAIELPTGAGKSLIALLIAEVWRREGKKAAILTGNKTLARQMEHEANALPSDGWLTRALSNDGPFISEGELLSEWQ